MGEGFSFKIESLKANYKKLKFDNKKLKSTLDSTKKSLSNQLSDYEALKANSSEFITLKSKYEKVLKQLTEKNQKVENIEKQISDSHLYYILKWALAVSGILLIGFIIGYSVKRPRRKPALL